MVSFAAPSGNDPSAWLQQVRSPLYPVQLVPHVVGADPPAQSASETHRFGRRAGGPLGVQQTSWPAVPAHAGEHVSSVWRFKNTEVVVTATWRSMSSSPAAARAAFASSNGLTNEGNAAASAACSPAIEPE